MSASRRSKPIRRFFLHHVLPPFGWRLYRALGRSWDYEERNISGLHKLIAQGQPVVGAFLHSRTFALLHYFSLPQQGRWILMCSQSRDGEAKKVSGFESRGALPARVVHEPSSR
jgi:lysophospholipid acyltransferase (LPLAT)-like uncharacterized protein